MIAALCVQSPRTPASTIARLKKPNPATVEKRTNSMALSFCGAQNFTREEPYPKAERDTTTAKAKR